MHIRYELPRQPVHLRDELVPFQRQVRLDRVVLEVVLLLPARLLPRLEVQLLELIERAGRRAGRRRRRHSYLTSYKVSARSTAPTPLRVVPIDARVGAQRNSLDQYLLVMAFGPPVENSCGNPPDFGRRARTVPERRLEPVDCNGTVGPFLLMFALQCAQRASLAPPSTCAHLSQWNGKGPLPTSRRPPNTGPTQESERGAFYIGNARAASRDDHRL